MASKRLDGKVAIITGGASGIGAATAKLFVQHGAKVIIADIQDDLGMSLCKTLEPNFNNIIYAHCDVTNDSDVKNAVDMAVSKYGKLDIMYNNAGITGDLNLSILASSDECFKRVFDVNVYGAFLGAKHAARVMIPAKRGVILFTSSIASILGGEAPHGYTASKHAVLGLMKSLCVEMGEHGIRVNCIAPGVVLTPLLTTESKKSKEEIRRGVCSAMVLKESVLEEEDVAEAALYLSSDESKYVSGVNLVLDGGYSTTNGSFTSALKAFSNGTTN